MLFEADQGEYQLEAEDDSKADADEAPGRYRIYGRVARCGVEKRAIGEDIFGSVVTKGEQAAGAIGQCAVGIEGEVPMLEGGQVEVDAPNDGVCGVVALRPGDDVPGVEDGHRVGANRRRQSIVFALSLLGQFSSRRSP